MARTFSHWISGTAWLLVILFATPSPAIAQESCSAESPAHRTAVVELFTSEGCSSCPPADLWVLQQAEQTPSTRVIYLSQHVPYWDYLGWQDRFALSHSEQRQRSLARSNSTSVYTPQFFVSGESPQRLGLNHLNKLIRNVQKKPSGVNLKLKKMGKKVKVIWQDSPSPDSRLILAITTRQVSSRVTAGENRGRELNHGQVIRWWQDQAIGQLGNNSYAFDLPRINDDGNGKIIVMMQKGKHILQALAIDRNCG